MWTLPLVSSPGAVSMLTFLSFFLVLYIAATLTSDNFANYDYSMYTLFTLKGHDLSLQIWRQSGRFFPLGEQEFNLARHFTRTVAGYHVLPVAQLLIFSSILLFLDGELSITARAALTTFALIDLGIAISFTGLIYEERTVLFCLACLVLFVKRFERTQSTAWAVAAVVCAQILIYQKETGFLLILGFAVGRLLLRCMDPDRAGWEFNRLRDKESRLDLCLTFLGLFFLLYYLAVMLPHPSMQYADQRRLLPLEAAFDYLKLDLLAWGFVAIALGRASLILRGRVAPSLLWDGLALGGLAYFAGYLCLRIFAAYYLAPVDLIAVLYLGRLAILSWGQMNLGNRMAALILLFAVLLQNVSLSAFRMFERQNVLLAKAEIASVVAARYQSGPKNAHRLFFPFADPYVVMEFAAYLEYRGIPMERGSPEPDGLNRVVLVSKAAPKDGPCVEYQYIICRASGSPDPGDLVIELPDDTESLAETDPYRKRGELLFSYQPHPRVPKWMGPLLSRLRIASPRFADRDLPDRWLHASVTDWK